MTLKLSHQFEIEFTTKADLFNLQRNFPGLPQEADMSRCAQNMTDMKLSSRKCFV